MNVSAPPSFSNFESARPFRNFSSEQRLAEQLGAVAQLSPPPPTPPSTPSTSSTHLQHREARVEQLHAVAELQVFRDAGVERLEHIRGVPEELRRVQHATHEVERTLLEEHAANHLRVWGQTGCEGREMWGGTCPGMPLCEGTEAGKVVCVCVCVRRQRRQRTRALVWAGSSSCLIMCKSMRHACKTGWMDGWAGRHGKTLLRTLLLWGKKSPNKSGVEHGLTLVMAGVDTVVQPFLVCDPVAEEFC
eukprot:315937-Chlamydomonas_euryale.AAC.3